MKQLFISLLIAALTATGTTKGEAMNILKNLNTETGIVEEVESTAVEVESTTIKVEETTVVVETSSEAKKEEETSKVVEETLPSIEQTTEESTTAKAEVETKAKEEETTKAKVEETSPVETEAETKGWSVDKNTGLPSERKDKYTHYSTHLIPELAEKDTWNSKFNLYRVIDEDGEDVGLYDFIYDHSKKIMEYEDNFIGFYASNWTYYEIEFNNNMSSYTMTERCQPTEKTIEEMVESLLY